MNITISHSTSTGHRVVGHEGGQGKCARLHGHTYTFFVELHSPKLDTIGFIVDYGVIKAVLDEWDHRIVLWEKDPDFIDLSGTLTDEQAGIVWLPFNPTAENMARHLAQRMVDLSPDITKAEVTVRESPKTSATAEVVR